MKTCKQAIQEINATYNAIDVIKKFLQTAKGRQMAEELQHSCLSVVLDKYEAPKFSHVKGLRGKMSLYNVYMSQIKHLHIEPTKVRGIENFTVAIDKKKKAGELKPARSLSKFEQKMLNMKDQFQVKLDKDGKPIIKTDAEGKLLYDAETGLPYYKYTRKPKPMGAAYKCHAYEEHKMKKWDKKHPAPTPVELAQDLFPEYLISAHEHFREKALETIRKRLSDLYYPVNVTVMVKNDTTDTVRRIECPRAVRLKKISSDLLSHKTPLKPKLIAKLRTIADNVRGNDRVTCVHLNCHNPAQGTIVMPDVLRLVA